MRCASGSKSYWPIMTKQKRTVFLGRGPAVNSMELAPGTELGHYKLVRLIGAGGMGEVYQATDTRLDRTVAIKVLPAHVAGNRQARERFEREARTISQLNHPHICTLFDVGQENGVDFLVMEYIEGETLAARLEKGALPLDQAMQHGIEIADALDKAHRHGVVHRDLKPGNIMLTKSGAKLLDFGLAKLMPEPSKLDPDAATATKMTREGGDCRHVAVHGSRTGRGQESRRADRPSSPSVRCSTKW